MNTNVCSTVYSGVDQRKHQSSAPLAFVWGIHLWPVNSPHKGQVTRKMFPFDDVIMCCRNHLTALRWPSVIMMMMIVLNKCITKCRLLYPGEGTPSVKLVGTVYPKKYAHGFVVLCFVVVMQSFIMNSHEVFIHIHQGCFAGTGAIVRLPQCQWSKPDGYEKKTVNVLPQQSKNRVHISWDILTVAWYRCTTPVLFCDRRSPPLLEYGKRATVATLNKKGVAYR